MHPVAARLSLLAAALLAAAAPRQDAGRPVQEESKPGPVLLAGGGSLPEELWTMLLGGRDPSETRVAILPFASSLEDAGERASRVFTRLGASSVTIVGPKPADDEMAALRAAHVIWIPGGDQGRFMEEIDPVAAQAIRERRLQGSAVGGTSAGAAVGSEVMIAGNAERGEGRLPPGPLIATGLKLVPEIIVDQHFTERGRLPRLLRAVLDHPRLLGVGIDEGTVAIVEGTAIRAFGRGGITILDARDAEAGKDEAGAHKLRGARLHILRNGDVFDWKQAK